jgi:hypothetical protein
MDERSELDWTSEVVSDSDRVTNIALDYESNQ